MRKPRFRGRERAGQDGTTPAPKRVRPVFVAVPLIAFIVLGYFSILSGIDTTVVTPGNFSNDRVVWTRLMPQGWAFFSKSPRDPLIGPYTLSKTGDVVSQSMLPSTQAKYLWGMSRNARAQGVEVAYYAADLQSGDWADCKSPIIDECVRQGKSLKAKPVKNPAPSPSVCGTSYLVESEPMPWSYRHLTEERFKALKIAKVKVQCLSPH